MTERTQHDDAAPGSPEPEKVHTFDLIDEVPGVSDRADDRAGDQAGGEAGGEGGADPDDDGAEPAAEDRPAEEPAPRAPGRVVTALAGARVAVGRTARRGVAAVRRRLPTTRRGKVLLVSGTAAVLVLAVAAAALVTVRLREQALVAAPGGVRSLETKPGEQWSIDLDNPISATLIEMPGVLAIVGDGKVRGVDPASGEVRWTVDSGQEPDCGPASNSGAGGPVTVRPADPLVCVASSGDGDDGGEETSRSVTVIEPDGAVTTRELDPAAVVTPAAGGSLLTVGLVGGEQEPRSVIVDKLGTPHLPKDFVGPDLVVRQEDAATGAERWSATLPFGSPRPESCLTYEDSAPVLDTTEVVNQTVRGDAVEVQGCGVSAAFLLDGTRLDDPKDQEDPPADSADAASFASLPDGGWVGPGPEPVEGGPRADVVHLADGGSVALGGRALVPWATDGRDPGLLLERVGTQTAARSTAGRDAGERLWTAPRLAATALLARVSGTAVVVDELGVVHAVDLGTGADRWTLDPDLLSFGNMAGVVESVVFGAYTDGDTLLLPVAADPSGEASGLRLLALDLRDGSKRWEIEQETPYTQLVSVDGYLAQITQQGVVGLG